jgi:carboxypeptidase C (cathepsin A)
MIFNISRLLLVSTLTFSIATAQDAGHPSAKDKKAPAEKKEEKKTDKPKEDDEEEFSETKHSVTIAGKKINYTARAGKLPLAKEDGTVRASIFYIAYERTNANPKKPRPVTFCFNGGPGSSSVWLHLGALGPKRVVLSDDGLTAPAPPYTLTDNEYSILDTTDLVFIDPVSTGYSRAAEEKNAKEFHGFQQDIDAVADFIRLYVTRNERWDSPKFLAGESYGAIRASGLASTLQDRYGMYINGVALVSGVLDFSTLMAHTSNDLPYIVFLPSMTAVAHFKNKLSDPLMADLKKTVAEAEAFAMGEYATGLLKGNALSADERAALVKKISTYTGLDEKFIDQHNLRVSATAFRKELLRENGLTLGRFDGRMEGADFQRAGDSPDYDPSYTIIYGAYASTLNAYLREDLKFETDMPYEVLTGKVHPWDYDRFTNRYVNVADNLAKALNSNTHLKIFVACGYHDLATPHLAIRYSIDHIPTAPNLRKNFTYGFYDGGHMMYTNIPSLAALKKDLDAWMK